MPRDGQRMQRRYTSARLGGNATRMAQEHEGTDQGGECVEVAAFAGIVGVRDSKDPDGGHLTLTSEAFAALVRALEKLR
ncbi:DUF397 domain-containing protein [Actinomadura madurae]|uniref:DUF397 domain-containing protein n=1 Tax=Actinomadura madurae TaxID=1993 RepID=UPI0027E263C3|nr:DUF397 domain-containing protein [Actinomadura madurae]